MGKKNKRGRGRPRAPLDHLKIAQRELEKRNAKLALEHARLQHQASASPESREVLERAFVARAEQLFERGNRELATELLDELRVLGVTVGDLEPQLEMLSVRLGQHPRVADSEVSGEDVLSDPVAQSLADEAVLHPHRRSPAYPQWNEQADWVRAALQQVESGQLEAAWERLSAIPRKSPLAEWRLFVRGLAAHYAGDVSRRAANWDRLSPERAAYRIANHLLVFAGQRRAEEVGFPTSNGQRRLKAALSGNAVLALLETMRDDFRARRIEPMLRTLRTLRQRHARSHAPLIERVTDLLWKHFVRESDSGGLFRLKRAVPGPALDPRWLRANGLLMDQQSECNLNRIEEVWFGYIQDLETCSVLGDEEREMAIGLVYHRLAKEFLEEVHSDQRDPLEPPFPLGSRRTEPDEEEAALLAKRAEFHLRKALSKCPRLLAVHRQLIDLLRERERSTEAVQAAIELLQHFPDDFDTLVWLSNYFIEAEQPVQAEPYVERASHLRPRDVAIAGLIWNRNLGLFRQRVRKRKFEEARHQLQELASLNGSVSGHQLMPYAFCVLGASLEYKAKNDQAAEVQLQKAQEFLEEPTPIWLIMHAYSERFSLRRPLKNLFRDRFKAAIQGACRSQTAGHMARFLRGYLARGVKYVGLATHQRLLIDYLKRARRVKWSPEDLHDVCRFLAESTEGRAVGVLVPLVEAGIRRFPDAPLFWFLRGQSVLGGLPWALPFLGRTTSDGEIKRLEKARELNKRAEFPLTASECERLETALKTARATQDMMSAFFKRMSFMADRICENDPGGEEDDDWDDWGDEDDDPDDDDREEGQPDVKGASAARPRGRRRASRASPDPQGRLF